MDILARNERSHFNMFLQVGLAQFRANFSKIAKQVPGSDRKSNSRNRIYNNRYYSIQWMYSILCQSPLIPSILFILGSVVGCQWKCWAVNRWLENWIVKWTWRSYSLSRNDHSFSHQTVNLSVARYWSWKCPWAYCSISHWSQDRLVFSQICAKLYKWKYSLGKPMKVIIFKIRFQNLWGKWTPTTVNALIKITLLKSLYFFKTKNLLENICI